MSLPDRQGLALEIAAGAGADLLVCADPANVHWLTGVAVDVETGPSPFNPTPVVLLEPGKPARLVASADDAPPDPPGDLQLLPYDGYALGALRGVEHAQRLVAESTDGRALAGDSLLARGLAADGAASFADVGDTLRDARAVKDAEALDAIRRALAVSDAGQRALREAVAEGRSEIELFAAARRAMELAAGARVPVLADLVSGPRTAAIGGPPSARAVSAGELVLCDLAPRVEGTWGDSCATVAAGEPTAEMHEAHRRVSEALERAMEAVRPGARAADVDAAVRAGLDYPHHTGHGLGSSYHEDPRIVPESTAVLREGMVVALEPALYAERFGLRLEHVVLVTADGCEDLSTHRLEL